jgi:hypothetical protein
VLNENAKVIDKIISKHNVFPEEVEQIFQGKAREAIRELSLLISNL